MSDLCRIGWSIELLEACVDPDFFSKTRPVTPRPVPPQPAPTSPFAPPPAQPPSPPAPSTPTPPPTQAAPPSGAATQVTRVPSLTQPYVFISYSHQDRSTVDDLAVKLDASGVPVWYDTTLSGADRFDHVLRERIDHCAVFVVVMSPASGSSAYVAQEVRRARETRRPIYPLLLAGLCFPGLANLHHETITHGLPSKVIDDLRRLLATPAPGARGARAMMIAVPPRNPHFVGREDLLISIGHQLVWRPVAVQALYGTGGIGKTQLAVEFAYRNADDYDLIAWINAEQADLIPGQLANLATALGLPTAASEARTAEEVIAVLGQAERKWLLVYDNAEKPTDLQSFLPRAGSGHVIITSRQTNWDVLGTPVNVDVMNEPEAIQLLRERLSTVDEADARQIVELLGRLPLAIDIAGGYLRSTRTPTTTFLDLLSRNAGRVLELRDMERSGPHAVLATLWDASQASLRIASPAAEQLLRLCAFLAPEPIPLELFTAQVGELTAPLSTVAADPIAFDQTLGELLRRSLARRDGNTVTLHRLLAAAVRQAVSEVERNDLVGTVRELLYQYLPASIANAPENWPQWKALLPHVLVATEYDTPLLAELDRTSWLLDRAANYMQTHGQPAGALPLMQRSVSIGEAIYGPTHTKLGVLLNNLAGVLKDLGQPAAARPLLERVLRIDEAAYPADHAEVATDLGNLALVLKDLGLPAEAKPLLERALRIAETVYGPDHPTVAVRLSNLATVLQDLDQPAQAQSLLERALHIDEAHYGPNHPTVAVRLNNLALSLKDLDQPALAQPLIERALHIHEAIYGPDHPRVATDLSNLAMVLLDLGRERDALPLIERTLRIDEASYGPHHPEVATDLGNLGRVLVALGQFRQAQSCFERAIAIFHATLGADHPNSKIIQRALDALRRG